MNRAVFLDRDGVINEIAYFPELGLLDSPLNANQFKLLPKVAEAIMLLNRLNLKVIVVSNQPAIAKGKMTREAFEEIRLKMKSELENSGAHLDGEYYCFHHPSARIAKYRVNCDCRKPSPGLFFMAKKDFDLDLKKCFVVGDSLTDVKAGKTVGSETFLIGSLKCDLCRLMQAERAEPDHIVADLYDASRVIEKETDGNVKQGLIMSKAFRKSGVTKR
jgi:D-glycero-D-manno-heptose 1,7-bisphosphate phosphatase